MKNKYPNSDLYRLDPEQQMMVNHWNRGQRRDRRERFRQKFTAKDVTVIFLAVMFALGLGFALSVPTILKFEALIAFTDYLNRQ